MRCAGACAAGAGFGDVVGEVVSRLPWAIVIGCVSVLLLAPVAFCAGKVSGAFVVELDLRTRAKTSAPQLAARPACVSTGQAWAMR